MTSDSRTAPTSHYFVSQRMRLHYVEWGSPDAPPLLLVHGGRDHCRNWDWVAAQLQKDWRVIAPDLRGHGDSQWSLDGNYASTGFVYDLSQLIHEKQLPPVTIVGHSLGGNIGLRYTGIYPENVRKVVAIEGIGPSPSLQAELDRKTIDQRMQEWIDAQRKLVTRTPHRYASVDDACNRMQEAHIRLTPQQARHLTEHGVRRHDDGTYAWKFDNHVNSGPPCGMTRSEKETLFGRITCPTLLVYGKESWASNPAEDGRINLFRNATVAMVEGAGHWVHHDRLDEFIALLRKFL